MGDQLSKPGPVDADPEAPPVQSTVTPSVQCQAVDIGGQQTRPLPLGDVIFNEQLQMSLIRSPKMGSGRRIQEQTTHEAIIKANKIGCTVCATDTTRTFCVDCRRMFCPDCEVKHNELLVLAGHHVTLRLLPHNNNIPAEQGPQHPHGTCTEHGAALDLCCAGHKTLICSTCKRLHHGECEDVQNISKVPKDTKDKGFDEVHTDTETLLEDLLNAKRSREDLLKQIDSLEEGDLDKIRKQREEIAKLLDETVEEMEKAVTERRKKERESIGNEMKDIEKKVKVAEMDHRKLSDLKNQNGLENELMSVDIHDVVKNVESGVEFMLSVGKNRFAPLATYLLNPDCKNHHGHFHCNGRFTTSERLKREYWLTVAECSTDQVDKVVNNDTITTTITRNLDGVFNIGTMIHRSQNVILSTIYTQNSIIALNLLDGKTVTFRIAGGPWGICQIKENEFAITCADVKLVVFYRFQEFVDHDEVIVSDFLLPFKTAGSCWDICYHDNELYIVFEESNWETDQAVYIGVYSLSGEELRKIEFDGQGQRIFSRAWHLKNHKGHIYVADESKGIIKMDKLGNELHHFTMNRLAKTSTFFILDNDDVVACGYGTENLVHFDKSGQVVGVVMRRWKDFMRQPTVMLYDVPRCTLFVASYESHVIQAFDMEGLW